MRAEYAFRVTGRLTPGLLTALDPLEANPMTTETLLVGWVADSAALHGHIAHIEALGLELVGLQRLPPRSPDVGPPGCGPGCGRRRAQARTAPERLPSDS